LVKHQIRKKFFPWKSYLHQNFQKKKCFHENSAARVKKCCGEFNTIEKKCMRALEHRYIEMPGANAIINIFGDFRQFWRKN
jgi:hypothetical protein